MLQEFAVAIAVSALVSLTLTPMMSARLLRNKTHQAEGRLRRVLEMGLGRAARAYDRCLIVAPRHRFIPLMTMLATVAASAWLLWENSAPASVTSQRAARPVPTAFVFLRAADLPEAEAIVELLIANTAKYSLAAPRAVALGFRGELAVWRGDAEDLAGRRERAAGS
jgi:hypothetical protein